MRAPPPPRRSKSRYIRKSLHRIYKFLTLQSLRRRWKLHKLHKVSRKNNLPHKQKKISDHVVTPLLIEDILGYQGELESPAKNNKPLLIASFPKGCAASPRVRILQRSRLSRIYISKRKYKLKNFNPGLLKAGKRDGSIKNSCAQRVHFIRKHVSKHADIKVNYHRKNIIKSTRIPVNVNDKRAPQLLEFSQAKSIRLNEYPSLSVKPPRKFSIAQRDKTGRIHVHTKCKKKIRKKLEETRWKIRQTFHRTTLGGNYPNIIVVSSAKVPEISGDDSLDEETNDVYAKINNVIDVSRLAGNAVSNYTQMVQKLNTMSPQATNTVRTMTVRRITG